MRLGYWFSRPKQKVKYAWLLMKASWSKPAHDVLVSVRNAIGGMDLDKLHEAVEREFRNLDEQEKSVRSVLAKLESGFIRRFAAFHHE